VSPSGDRVSIPTNGHHPPMAADAPAPAADAPAPAADSAPASSDMPTVGVDRSASLTDLRVAVTPGQAIVGFGILASLVLLVLGRRARADRARHDA
jgi:hypothetical protein